MDPEPLSPTSQEPVSPNPLLDVPLTKRQPFLFKVGLGFVVYLLVVIGLWWLLKAIGFDPAGRGILVAVLGAISYLIIQLYQNYK